MTLSKTVLSVVAVFVVVGVLGIALIMGYLGFRTDALNFETDINATYQNNKNVYDNGWKKVKEVAQVPDMYSNDLKAQFQAALTSRYGADGSKALFQMIKEQNPNLSPEMYLKVQRTVEAFRDDFSANQTKLTSVKQSYGRFMNTPSAAFYNLLGNYPHIKCGIPIGSQDDYAIVTSDKTEDDFKTKKADELKLR